MRRECNTVMEVLSDMSRAYSVDIAATDDSGEGDSIRICCTSLRGANAIRNAILKHSVDYIDPYSGLVCVEHV